MSLDSYANFQAQSVHILEHSQKPYGVDTIIITNYRWGNQGLQRVSNLDSVLGKGKLSGAWSPLQTIPFLC